MEQNKCPDCGCKEQIIFYGRIMCSLCKKEYGRINKRTGRTEKNSSGVSQLQHFIRQRKFHY